MKTTILSLCIAIAINQVFAEVDLKASVVLSSTDPTTTARGTVVFSQNVNGGPTHVLVHVTGLNPGKKYGFHIHEKGDLSNGCDTLGGHYNPEKMNHGAPNASVRHVGDLGNIEADPNGVAMIEFNDRLISLVGSRTIVGRGVIVHEGEDDLGLGGHSASLTTGNAGGRMICGVIGFQSLIDELPNSAPRSVGGIFGIVLLVSVSLGLSSM